MKKAVRSARCVKVEIKALTLERDTPVDVDLNLLKDLARAEAERYRGSKIPRHPVAFSSVSNYFLKFKSQPKEAEFIGLFTKIEMDTNALENNGKNSKLFTTIIPKYNLNDVVLSDRNRRQIEEALAELKNKSLIYDQWGFSDTIKRNRGIVMLFVGAPGTGKTMTAEALAKCLGKELLVVNYAQLESCWVGETAKNIERAFKEAKDKNVILLFDEADSLLTSREFDSIQPYHIGELNLFLEKVEEFEGIVILITNLGSILDPALERRIDLIINFDFPAADMCEQIYRKMISDRAPIGKDVDFKELARKYPLAGGKILNVVKSAVRSALLRGSKEITMEDFEKAAKVEYERPAMLRRNGLCYPHNQKHRTLEEEVPKYI